MGTDLMFLANTVSISWYERLVAPFKYYPEPLLGSVLIGAVLGVLGCFVILRRMAMIGDAISHAVLPGVVVAFLLVSTGITGLFVGALLAGILTAIGINVVSRFSRVKEDAAVGIVFTAMFAETGRCLSHQPGVQHRFPFCIARNEPRTADSKGCIGHPCCPG